MANKAVKCENHPRRNADFIFKDGTGKCKQCSLELSIKSTVEAIKQCEDHVLWLKGRLAKYLVQLESVNKRYERK